MSLLGLVIIHDGVKDDDEFAHGWKMEIERALQAFINEEATIDVAASMTVMCRMRY